MDEFVIFLVVILGAVVFVYLWSRDEQKKKDVFEQARLYYTGALDDLRADPNNSQKRALALKLGRQYADFVSDDKRNTFDEVALMNDLNAIQATPTSAASSDSLSETIDVRPSADAIESRLQNLISLQEKGLISESEYQERRASILDEI